MQNRLINKAIVLLFILKTILFSQAASFVSVQNGKFYLNNERFYPLGSNAYYLHKYACSNDTVSIHELFKSMKELRMNCVRTWAFSDGEEATNIFILQSAPYTWNEKSLQKLDYILDVSRLYDIKVILTFVNNWDDLGGMNQYLKWYAGINFKKEINAKEAERIFSKTESGKYYVSNLTNSINHDDFYKLDTIKAWYKAYFSMLLNRKNSYSQVVYKEDKTIMAFELANEPESADKTGNLIYNWVVEMSGYFKAIDKNHLLSTGEEGFDIDKNGYGSYAASWLFNGTKGIGFKMNSGVVNIDYCTAHLYAEYGNNISWTLWIYDHQNIASNLKKPFLLGEYGSKQNRIMNFGSWLNAVKETNTDGALLWQLVPTNFKYEDGYTIKHTVNMEECNLIKKYYDIIRSKNRIIYESGIFTNVYPNPAKKEVYINFRQETTGAVKYYLYNVLGELIMSDNKIFQKGNGTIIINAAQLSSGVYLVKFENERNTEIKKFTIIK